jgi:ABC-type antimicrobial peptide transport system permease subunit
VLHVRTSGDTSAALTAIQRLVRGIDRHVTATESRTMREAISTALVPTRIAQTVLGASGVIALLLAFGGLYGLVAYALQQRTKEIAIRVALGASRARVFRLVVGGVVRLAAIGIVAGALLAAGAMRVLQSLLVGLGPGDPPTYAAVAALLLVVTVAAGYAAARNGLRVDPAAVLRC